MLAPKLKKKRGNSFPVPTYESLWLVGAILSIAAVPFKMKVLRSTGDGSPETLRFQDPNVENEKSTSTMRIFTVSRMKTVFKFGYTCGYCSRPKCAHGWLE